MMVLKKKGQATAEYAIVIALVIGALFAIQTYVKRGWQGRAKDEVDAFGAVVSNTDNWMIEVEGGQEELGKKGVVFKAQYEPYYIQSSFAGSGSADKHEHVVIGGERTKTETETSEREGEQTYGYDPTVAPYE